VRAQDRAPGLIDALGRPRADEPGLAVSVTRGARVVEWDCAGLASLEHRVPIGPQTRFHVVSVSKTFAAAAVLALAARGRLGLDDDVRRHLPELPAEISRHATVTIRHLLSMTSGLRDVLEIERLRGVWRASPFSARDLFALACRQADASAAPGARYIYGNVNAVLLEEIVRRASGTSPESFRRSALCEPLGLAATSARPHEGIVVPDLAEPYVPDGSGGWSRATDLLGIAADPLTTSLDDLTRWVLALRSGAAGDGVLRAMAQPARLADGRAIYYGLGLAVRRYRGLTVLCHTGSQPGYKAHIAFAPERDLGLAILSNREDTAVTAGAAAIMERAIGDGFPSPHPARDARRRLAEAGFTAEQEKAIEGEYVDLDAGEWVALSIEGGVLRGETLGDPFFLYHAGGGVFRDADDYRATLPVELALAGRGPVQMNLGGQPVALARCVRRPPDAEALTGLPGGYESAALDSRHRVRREGGGLVVDYGLGGGSGRTFAMEAIGADAFLVRPAAPGIAYRHLWSFERDRQGRVVAAVVSMERLKRVRLPRAGSTSP